MCADRLAISGCFLQGVLNLYVKRNRNVTESIFYLIFYLEKNLRQSKRLHTHTKKSQQHNLFCPSNYLFFHLSPFNSLKKNITILGFRTTLGVGFMRCNEQVDGAFM